MQPKNAQILLLVLLAAFTYAVHWVMTDIFSFSAASADHVRSVFLLLLMVSVPVACYYFICLLELKKPHPFFQHRFWQKAPLIIGMVGILSLIAFMVCFITFFSLNGAQQWGWAVIAVYDYFVFLFYLFVFSLCFKRMGRKEEKTRAGELAATYSVWVVLGTFVAAYYFFPGL